MTTVTVIYFVRKVTLYFSTAAGNSRLVTWKHGYSLEQKEVFERRRKLVIWQIEKKENYSWSVSGIWSCKFYDTSDLEKQNHSF